MQIPDFNFISFATQIESQDTANRPYRNSLNGQIQTIEKRSISTPYQRLKHMKQKAKRMQKQYLTQTINNHKILRSLDYINKQSLLRRVQFLKIYGNKKSMFQHQQLLQKTKRLQQQHQRRSIDVVKQRKLENQLHHILVQNQEEQYVSQLQQFNRTQQESFRKKLEIVNQKQMSRKHHQKIKRQNNQFMIRKKNIQTSNTIRSKSNYYTKINQELNRIKHYEDIISSMEGFSLVTEDKSQYQTIQTMANTIDSNRKAFATNPFAFKF